MTTLYDVGDEIHDGAAVGVTVPPDVYVPLTAEATVNCVGLTIEVIATEVKLSALAGDEVIPEIVTVSPTEKLFAADVVYVFVDPE